jgi:hypothetical protein
VGKGNRSPGKGTRPRTRSAGAGSRQPQLIEPHTLNWVAEQRGRAGGAQSLCQSFSPTDAFRLIAQPATALSLCRLTSPRRLGAPASRYATIHTKLGNVDIAQGGTLRYVRSIFGGASVFLCHSRRHMLERIIRCPNCGREIKRRGLSLAENPFCAQCLHDRANAPGLRRATGWVLKDGYVAPIRDARRRG